MAIEQIDIKDYTGAEINTVKAIQLLIPIKKYPQLNHCYNNLGIIHKNLGNYDKALEYYNQALVYLEKVNKNKRNALELIILNNIGVVHRNLKNYEEAIKYYKKAQDKTRQKTWV